MADTPGAAPASRAGLVLAERILASVVALMVLIQAAMAGHSTRLRGTGGISIELHGVVGNATFTLIVVELVLAFVIKASTGRLAVLGGLTVLAVAQTGLGYMGRSSVDAAGWHVPLGVLIFGLATYNIVQARAAAGQPVTPAV